MGWGGVGGEESKSFGVIGGGARVGPGVHRAPAPWGQVRQSQDGGSATNRGGATQHKGRGRRARGWPCGTPGGSSCPERGPQALLPASAGTCRCLSRGPHGRAAGRGLHEALAAHLHRRAPSPGPRGPRRCGKMAAQLGAGLAMWHTSRGSAGGRDPAPHALKRRFNGNSWGPRPTIKTSVPRWQELVPELRASGSPSQHLSTGKCWCLERRASGNGGPPRPRGPGHPRSPGSQAPPPGSSPLRTAAGGRRSGHAAQAKGSRRAQPPRHMPTCPLARL